MEGKWVKIKAKGRIFEGIAMPSEGRLVLKLDNGYNVGFYDYEILEVKDIETVKSTPPKLEMNPEIPNVKVISTGGTIASRVDYKTGAVTSQFTAEEIVADIPELSEICNIDAELLFNILSENIKVEHWIKLAREIYKSLKEDYTGVIVTHGTDTMHYTSSAISFMLRTPKPRYLRGSSEKQRQTE